MRLLILSAALALSACAPTADLPDADEATERGIRPVWAAVQDAVRTGDAASLAALEDPAPGAVDPGSAEDVAARIVAWTRADADLRDAILAARAFDLGQPDDGRYVFIYSPAGGPQPDGYEITFRQAEDGEVFLTTASEIG